MMHLLDHPDLQTHTCEAMYTTVTLHLECPDAERAADAASACFNQIETIEAQLSRFRHDSDVSRINQLDAGATLLIAEHTYNCLRQSFEANAMTDGLFDVTMGAVTWPEGQSPGLEQPVITGRLELAPDQPLVTCHEPGRQVDLGGIGKGYALDRLAGTLAAYRIDSALLCAGASTMLALGPQTWPIALTGDADTRRIRLQSCALSASGTGIQGAHVIHPGCPGDVPPYRFKRAWLTAPSAALADACATACLLMDDDEIGRFAALHRDAMRIHVEDVDDGQIRSYGKGGWDGRTAGAGD